MSLKSIKRKIKSYKNIYNVYLYFRTIMLSIKDIFIYGPLSYDNNLEAQFDQDKITDINVTVQAQIKQRKYAQPFERLSGKIKVLDLACGRGELEVILQEKYRNDFTYLGLDYDDNRISLGKSVGRNIRKFDVSDFEKLDELIKEEGPFDVIFCMYALYFFPRPEAFLKALHGKAPKVILAIFNGGNWSKRLRYLFGKAPIPSITHYSTFHTNYEEMKRLWTLRDYEFVFNSLGYSYELIAVKSDATSIHYKPSRFILPSLSALGFIFLLEPKKTD